MNKTDDLFVVKDFAGRLRESGEQGETLINQANHNSEEPILSDEDTAGRQPLQVLRIVVKAKEESLYFEYIFHEAIELEELNVQLKDVYASFPKKVISTKEMNDLVSSS